MIKRDVTNFLTIKTPEYISHTLHLHTESWELNTWLK